MATLIYTGCHSHRDPAYKWLSPGQGTKNNFSICRKGSASAPEITKPFPPFLASRRVHSPWAFRCAPGMPQECTCNPPEQEMTEKQRLCCSQQPRPVLFLATKIPKNLMCPATGEALETPLPTTVPRGDGGLPTTGWVTLSRIRLS